MSEHETIQSFPLQWPVGWRRVRPEDRKRANFGERKEVYRKNYQTGKMERAAYKQKQALTVAGAVARVMGELAAMGLGDWQIIVSTNVKPRLDGLPRSMEAEPKDPGAAVYWQHGESGNHMRATGHRCIAVDRYDRVADNLAAVAATLEAMRAIERHGGAAILERAFVGFKALPEPEQWWQALGLDSPDVTAEQIQAAYIKKARESHPDMPDGDPTAMARINAARDCGLEEIALGVGR